MAHATASLRPWLTHPRMWSKWSGFLVSTGVAAAFWHPWSWLAAVIGLLWFFPSEYITHRWIYHRTAVAPDPPRVARNHILHHIDPTDLGHIFNDPRFSVVIGVLNVVVAFPLLLLWHPWQAALGLAFAFSAGNFWGLVYYEYIHLTAHRPGATPWLPWGKGLKRSHMWHHYKNEHYWFGVTTQVIDKALGSWREPGEAEKSETVRSLVPPGQLRDWIGEE